MTAIPILSGYIANETADFAQSYPINLEPVVAETGLSKGYLKGAPGATQIGTGPGIDRGGINWNGVCYRVMGSKLVTVTVDGTVTVLGDVGSDGNPVSLHYSFDRLSIGSNGNLFYYSPTLGVIQVTDPDLGLVVDHVYVDGYFMTTDGENIVVTELNDPMAVDPLKYGSSETDPDPVMGLILVRGEVYAPNRYTVDVFNNVGGNGFPFQLNQGAVIPRGAVGTNAKCLFGDSFAFVGSGVGEGLGVYLAGSGQTVKISTRRIDKVLAAEENPENIVCERIVEGDEQRLHVHLAAQTLIFLATASLDLNTSVWYIRRGGAALDSHYRPRFFTNIGNEWICGDTDSAAVGRRDHTTFRDFGQVNGWRLDTAFAYNDGKGAILHSLELVGLPGRVQFGQRPVAFFSYTRDGETWSEERAASVGTSGQRGKRVQIRPHWRMRNYIGLRMRGADDALTGWARLEAEVEPLAV